RESGDPRELLVRGLADAAADHGWPSLQGEHADRLLIANSVEGAEEQEEAEAAAFEEDTAAEGRTGPTTDQPRSAISTRSTNGVGADRSPIRADRLHRGGICARAACTTAEHDRHRRPLGVGRR